MTYYYSWETRVFLVSLVEVDTKSVVKLLLLAELGQEPEPKTNGLDRRRVVGDGQKIRSRHAHAVDLFGLFDKFGVGFATGESLLVHGLYVLSGKCNAGVLVVLRHLHRVVGEKCKVGSKGGVLLR